MAISVANAPLPNPVSPGFLEMIIEDQLLQTAAQVARLRVEELWTQFMDDAEENIHAVFRNAGIELEDLEDEEFINQLIADGTGIPPEYI